MTGSLYQPAGLPDGGKSSPGIFGFISAASRILLGFLIVLMPLTGCSDETEPASPATPGEIGIEHQSHRIASVPWFINVVRVDRFPARFEIQSVHAKGGAVGLATLTEQIQDTGLRIAPPVAGINGDFYKRDGPYTGDPRGLQITNGELISGPNGGNGGACFWTDAIGDPHTDIIESDFQIGWPNGKSTPFALNGERSHDTIEVYTPALGRKTHSASGRELILERGAAGPWLPLHIGRTYQARIRAIHEGGGTPISPETVVVSIPAGMIASLPPLQPGTLLTLSTLTTPILRGVKTAIGTGPVLLRKGRIQPLPKGDQDSFEFNSMTERHPRSAIGWNENSYYLVEVDGRQRQLSVGMTLEELASYMGQLGCESAVSLDGGGSATLWCDGKVQNSPCDGHERLIANSIIVVRKKPFQRLMESKSSD
jgi:hypothetical protein